MGWWKPYNISGTVHSEDRLDELCNVVRDVLGTDDLYLMGHFTGAITVTGQSSRALFISSGFDHHEFFAHVSGERWSWLSFAREFEERLQRLNFPYSITVHDRTINEESNTHLV